MSKKRPKTRKTTSNPVPETDDCPEIDPYLAVNADRFLSELFRIEAERIWNEFQIWCNKYQKKQTVLSDNKFLFRGAPNKAYRLVPSAFRVKPYDPLKEAHIFNEFIRQACSYYPDIHLKSCVEKMAIAQHHGLPTRLLDWTSNPYVAAFFACSGEQEALTSAWITAANVSLKEPPKDDLFGKAFSKKEILFIKTPVAFPRIERQEGFFSLHSNPNEELPLDGDNTFEVPAFAKIYVLRKLRNYGISDKALMADLNGVSKTLSRDYSKITSKQLDGLLISYLGDKTVKLLGERFEESVPIFKQNYEIKEVNYSRADKMEIIFAGIGKIFSVVVSSRGEFSKELESKMASCGEGGRLVESWLRCIINAHARFLVKVNQTDGVASVEKQSFKTTFVLDEHLHQAAIAILSANTVLKSNGSDGIAFVDAPHYDFENDVLTVAAEAISKNRSVAQIRLGFYEVCAKHPGAIAVDKISEHLMSLAHEPEITLIGKTK